MPVYAGQIEDLRDNGDGTVRLCVANEMFPRDVPGTALTIELLPATIEQVMAWHAKTRGGAFARMVTDNGIRPFDRGVSANFSSNPLAE